MIEGGKERANRSSGVVGTKGERVFMADAEKLRILAMDFLSSAGRTIQIEQEDATIHSEFLRRIADLLESVPPEILKALQAGEMIATHGGLARFVADILSKSDEPEDIDGFWLQDKMEKHGVITAVKVEAPCRADGSCTCADYDFPTECYRYTQPVKDFLAALAAPEKP